ncbi:adenylate/guanylate cyclase domain-containing protein [Aurantimonas marina]|uniref:adenylate/guanylate cyclase domain-containing protein n=1 Tax=Aurantimonas marina TaxID=2780508 RepID=UPI0019CFF1DB|nr:adenylate/guanylate cyclase domain-containing protein [Aurantimonas marina]
MARPIRRLAAILSMDMEGFSGLVEADEAAALRAVVHTYRKRVLPTIGDYGGTVFKTTGDGLLAEFTSAVSAVKWTACFQRAMAADEPDDAPLRVRTGIVIGDVVVSDDDRFGEGVNMAARVQALSPAGGMAISRGVFEYLTGKTDLYFTDIGEQSLKGFSGRHRIWVWDPKIVGVSRRSPVAVPDPATHPSIAVLPFDNLSNNAERDSFIEGMVEEITASLSRVREFLVIARHSAYAYRGRSLDVRAIATELGVRYLLEGSVRFAGERMRVSLRLVDGETAMQIWSDRIEAEVADVFEVQDHIAELVSGALHPTIRQAEVDRSRRKAPESLVAYDLVMRALPHLWAHRRDENIRAIALLGEALTLEPDNGRAAAICAWAHAQHIVYNWSEDFAAERAAGRAHLEATAGQIDDDPLALTAAATAIMLTDGALDRANALIDRALDIDVNHAWAWTRRGFARVYAGRPDEAFACFERSMRLSPRDPFSFNSIVGMGLSHFSAGRPAEAARWTRRALVEKPGMTWPLRDLATFLASAGEMDEARRALLAFLAIRPDVTAAAVRDALHFMEPALLDRYVGGLLAAGLRDNSAPPAWLARG